MRAPPHALGIAISASAFLACSLTTDFSGLTGGSDSGAPPSDASRADAAAVPSDAGDGRDGAGLPEAAAAPQWSRTLAIANGAATPLPASYTVCAAAPGIAGVDLVAGGHVRADYADLRVVGPSGEAKRTIDVLAAGRLELCFRLQRAIAANETDRGYRLTYGDPSAKPAPDGAADVFDFYDGFDGGAVDTGRWLVHGAPVVGGGRLKLPRGTSQPGVTTKAAADLVPPRASLEMRVRVADVTSDPDAQDGFFYWFGFQHTGDFDASEPWTVFIARGKGSIGAEHVTSAGECVDTCADAPRPQPSGEFRVYHIDRDSTGATFRYDDGTTFHANVDSGDMSIMARSYLVTSDVDIDWIRARPLIVPEPALTLGAEEAAP